MPPPPLIARAVVLASVRVGSSTIGAGPGLPKLAVEVPGRGALRSTWARLPCWRAFSWWGEKNCVWSSDYPHFNMSYPHSRENVEKHLRGLPDAKRRKLVRDNAVELFGLPI